MRAADDALIAARRRMLFEKATGTGKTLTIAMLMKRWFQAALISQVLFLADRIELAKQAKETFDDYLRDYPIELLFGGKRAQKITCYSNNGNPKPVIDRFKFDPLPVIAVSVDMLDTGYDHKEVENLVMLRPTNSAIKYAQMRGRGSQLCPRIGKTSFLIYDFVGNHARFNDPGAQYHRPKQVGRRPPPGPAPGPEPGPEPTPPPPPGPPGPPRGFKFIAEGSLEDTIRRREMIHVGPAGMAIDRKTYQDCWLRRIQELRDTDPAVRKILAGEQLTETEWEELARQFNTPELYFDEPALRKAFEQPTGSLSDFIRAALGLCELPTREQRVERTFNAWVAEHSSSINPDQARLLSLLRNVVMAAAREAVFVQLNPGIFTQPPFTFQGGRARAEALFGRDRLTAIMEELNALIAAA